MVDRLENRTLFSAISPSVVDLFVGYTAADVAAVGSQQLMVDKINRGVQLMNQTLANSKIAASMRLVGTMQTNYVESNDGNVDLGHLTAAGDPQMADLKTAAAAAGADITDIVVSKIAGLGGITQNNYNVILLSYLDNGVLSHELGHSFGGGHPHSQDTANLPGAYEGTLNFGNQSYAGAIGGSLNYFSNPNVFFYGQATGVAGFGPTASNNAYYMNQNAPGLAAIFATKTADTTGPTAELGSIWVPNAAAGATGSTPLSRAGWVVTSNTNGTEPGSNAIDGNAGTRFSSGANQTNGQYLQVDLGSTQTFSSLTLDAGASVNDYPRGYAVYVSNDGTDWSTQQSIATGAGTGALTNITFNQTTARYVRIVQTGSSDQYWWSVAELNINASAPAVANAITFQVIYTDGSGVNVASLGDNNITVTGPNGFSRAAKLTSVDDVSVNYGYHVATYTVTTPGAVGPLSGYTFNMNANAVADTVGNTSAAGVIGGPSPLSPDYAGSDIVHSADIGDLAGKTWQITDEVGSKYQGGYFDPAEYHFSVSQDTTLTVNMPATTTSGVPLSVTVTQDANNNLLDDNGEEIQPTSPGVFNLKAGTNYYMSFSCWQQGMIPYGLFTATVTSSTPAVVKPAGGSISGSLYTDVNSNGLRDAGDTAIKLGAVQLTGTDSSGKAVSQFAYTDADGNYLFSNVAPSSAAGYTVTELPVYANAAQLNQGVTTVGSLGGTAAGNAITGIVVQSGSAGTGYVFSNQPLQPLATATLSGRVYLDTSTQQDANDPQNVGIGGVQLILVGKDARGNAVSLTATSLPTGYYTFTGIPQGDSTGYTLTIVQPTTTQLEGVVPGNLAGSLGILANGFSKLQINGVAGSGYDFPQIPLTGAAPTATNTTANGTQNGTVTGTVAGTTPQANAALAVKSLVKSEATPAITAALIPGTGPSHAASFTFNADGTYTYTPVKNFYGTDSFQYELIAANGAASVATVKINIAHVDQAPTFSTELDGPIFTSARDAVTVDLNTRVTDIDSSKLKYKITKVIGGTAKLLSDGHTLVYTPDPKFYGGAGVMFTASDGKMTTSLMLPICVCLVGAPPVAKSDYAITLQNHAVTINPLVNDTTNNVGGLTLVTVTPPKHGTATIVTKGTKQSVVYKPSANFFGIETFKYEVRDAFGKSSWGTITVVVLPVHGRNGCGFSDVLITA